MELSKQMELFEDGGLKDEGGMVDEVSGNDVPTGSTREEVRDDIPAQLSEGEFVLPADVVRYHGLEKIMELRDEAKQGLQKMEAMGQMGNSEEAILPDDVPFDMDDLDIEDDEPQEMEMAEGGYVMVGGKPMPVPTVAGKPLNMQVGGFTNPTGTYQVPTNIATQPSYFANYAQSIAPFQPFKPSQTFQPRPVEAGQKQSYIPFNQLIPTVNARRETFEYRNAAGQKLFIPFINGQPIYPIPEGYRRYTEEQQTQTKQAPVTGTTTQVTGDGDSDVLSGTTQVRGIDNSLVDTNFASQTKDKVAENIGKMGSSDRGKSVMDAIDASRGMSTLGKSLTTAGMSLLGGPIGSAMGAYDAISKFSGGKGLGIGQPDMASRDAITGAFGYDPTGYDFDDPMDANLAGIDQQNAINTAIFGGVVTGTEDKTRGGIKGITVADIQKEYGIAPSYTNLGAGNVAIARGTNPGQISSTGTFYDVNGVGNDPDKAEYSSMTDMLDYLSTASKFGYAGTLGRAKEQAKQGNKKAQQVVNAMQNKSAFREMEKDTRSEEEVASDLDAISQEAAQSAQGKAEKGFTDMSAFGDTDTSTSTGTGTSMGAADMGLGDISTDNDGGSADSSGCVIATHGLSTGGFTAMEKAKAELWCQKTYHGKWYGEAFRKGYRAAGMKHINAGTAPSVYQEFKDFVAYGRGIKKGWKVGFNYYLRTITFFLHGLFIK